MCLLLAGIWFPGRGTAWGAQKPSLQNVTGSVSDALGRPAAKAEVILRTASGVEVAKTATDGQGHFELKRVPLGTYVLMVRKEGYKPATKVVEALGPAANSANIVLESQQPLTVAVRASRLSAQNGLSPTGNNKYTMTAKDISNLPEGDSTPLNNVMLQMPGVALDQNQEIHIRGEHMGIQYQMNGIMLPLDINTDPTFTQLLNATFVKSVSLLDGVLPVQYGYRTSGVIDIETKDGCGDNHNNATIFGGQRDTAQGNFQLGGCDGNLSYYLTGQFLQSNLRFQLRGAGARSNS